MPWPPGGITDVISRGLGVALTESLGQQIVPDNRPGAAGTLGVAIAAKQGSVFPPDFNLDISINVLAVVIIGGMGNVRGVLLGSFLVVGLPDVLRDFSLNLGFVEFQDIGADYRLIIFGAALVAIMVLRPEGFLPSKRRAAEFREAELLEQEFAT